MNITLLRTASPITRQASLAQHLLARKLQACATGIYPQQDASSLFLDQAINLSNMSAVAHSVLASLEECSR